MMNINTNLDYQGPRTIYEVMTEINFHFPAVAYSHTIAAKSGYTAQDKITNLEKSMVLMRSEIGSLNGRITKIEDDAMRNPSPSTMARRVAATAALVLAYILLAASVVFSPFICVFEMRYDAFAVVSKGYSPEQLEKDKQRRTVLQSQLKVQEESVAGLNELRAKAPAAIQTLEQRIALLKQTEADILADAKKNPLWYSLVGNNSRVLHQYETALLWFRQAVVAA